MVYITQKAAYKFEQLRQVQRRPQAALRVAVAGGDCAGLKYFIGLDEFRASDDIHIESKGIPIYVDQTSLAYIWGSEIEWIELEDDAGFAILENPNQGRSKGGCGKDGKGCMTIGDGKTCQSKKQGGSCGSSACSKSCGSEEPLQISLT